MLLVGLIVFPEAGGVGSVPCSERSTYESKYSRAGVETEGEGEAVLPAKEVGVGGSRYAGEGKYVGRKE